MSFLQEKDTLDVNLEDFPRESNSLKDQCL